jgi:hypothetical protein
VVGHIVATRNVTLRALNAPVVWNDGEAEPYARGARPPLAAARAQDLPAILSALDDSQRTLVDRLRTLTTDELARPAGNGTLGEFLATLSFHEAYHAGQCGLLRRLAGLDGAIA